MAKTVFIVRHGKSDWNAAYATDHERPIAPRGRNAARMMGRFIRDSGQIPDLVIASSALRARSTAELAAQAGEWPAALQIEPRLYGARASTVLELVQAQAQNLESVMLVGHEPTCSACIGLLSGRSNVRFPTAAMARIDFDVDCWERIRAQRGCLIWLLAPKDLKRVVTD